MNRIDYEFFKLDNGLKVYIHQDHSIPKVVVNILYNVGARHEAPERTGFAHLFEHLMFGGSKNVPDYDTQLQKVGGDNNAFTNNDITNYYLSVPSNAIETGFWLESDRMLELDFSQKSLDVQKSVVIEEYKQRYLNRPYGDAHHYLRPLHYQKHPYRWPTIGKDISHIEGATLEDVKNFFYGFYAPNNATLVVAGDVRTEDVRKLAEKWFGGIPERELKHPEIPVEPPQQEARHKEVIKDVPYHAVYKMYHVPSRKDERYYTVDLITDILSGGKSSRLYQALVKEKQICTQVSAYSWGAHDPGAISIDAILAEGVTPEQYETALAEVLKTMEKVEAHELQRTKNMIESYYMLDRTRIFNKALSIAMSDILGDVELVNTSMDKYLAVSTHDIAEAAAEFIRPENSSTLYYLSESQHAS